MIVNEAIPIFSAAKKIQGNLSVLQGLGLGYLTLGEDTPALSGGEAQRLKLASEMESISWKTFDGGRKPAKWAEWVKQKVYQLSKK